MESKKINQLATEMSPAASDLTIIGDPITGVSKKITLEQISSLFSSSISFYSNYASFPATGSVDTLYCAKDTNKLYLWSGSAYVQTFPSQALLDTYQLRSEKGAVNGYASLDGSGKVPVSQLPSSIMEYKGMWDAATNTPTLANGTGDTGDVYICNIAGTVNFGAGAITFAVGDYVIYSGSIWQRSSGAVGTVTSVAVTESGDALTITGSPITTSGTINIGFAGTSAQYVAGDGSLVTFPSLTGYVPYTGATANVDLGEYELKAGQLTLDTTPTGTASVGTTRWNDTIGSSETTLKGGNVILKNGIDLVARIVNKVSPNTTLTKAAYPAVRVSGAQGQRLAVAYAQANNDNNSADTIGLVIETIATNQEGFIMTVGQIEGVDTTGSLQGETWADGDVLYLSPSTAGALTNIKPTGATGHIVVMGYVEYAHANNGKIYVKIMNGWELDELHNVYISSVANNQGLFYESSTSLWKNKSIATVLGYTPANDASVVHLAGTETITGTKFFDTPIALNNALNLKFDVSINAFGGYYSLYAIKGSGSANSVLAIYDGDTNKKSSLTFDNTNNFIYTFPSASGTLALTSDLSSYVPTSRTLTINGTTYDLSANRSWTITAGVSSVTATSPLFSSGGATPDITIQVANTSQSGYLSSTDWNTFNGKQAQINGTGFVKASGTTISYDNSTYLTTSAASSTYLPLSGGTLTGALNGTSAVFSSSVTANNNISAIRVGSSVTTLGQSRYLDLSDYYGNTNARMEIGLGYSAATGITNIPAIIGYLQTSTSGYTYGDIYFATRSVTTDTAPTERMRITSGGNVGIGTSSPNYPLEVIGAGSFTSSGSSVLYLKNTAGSGNRNWRIVTNNAAAGDITFDQSTTDQGSSYATKLVITSGGNVLIGTTTDGGKLLDVRTSTYNRISSYFTGSYTSGWQFSDLLGGIWHNAAIDQLNIHSNAAGGFITLTTNSSERMRITSSGDVCINTTTSGGYKLNVNGSASFGSVYVGSLGTGTVYSSSGSLTNTNPSDRRLKENITPIVYGLNEILQLNPVSFDWKNDNNKNKQFGFIAQEVKEIMPEAIIEGEYLGLEKDAINTALVNAIKEIVEKYDNKISILEAQIELLSNKIVALKLK